MSGRTLYMQQRYYDPLAGRFLSVDPITTDANTGGQFVRYDYVSNNPFKYTDPDGRAKSSGGGFGFGWEEVSNFADTTVTGGYGLQFKEAAKAGNYGEAGLKLTAGVVYGVLNVATLGEGAAVVAAASKGLTFAAKGAVEGLGFARSQLQHGFKHAKDFGVSGNASNKTLSEFSSAVQSHVNGAGTQVIQGTYRGNPVTHHVDPSTGLNVIRDSSGNFLSGWKLSPEQLQNVVTRGKL